MKEIMTLNDDNNKRHLLRKHHLQEKKNEIPSRYAGDIRRFHRYCLMTQQEISLDAMLDYLYLAIVQEKIKKTTWERRLAAIKKFFIVHYDIHFQSETAIMHEITMMRRLYNEEQYADQIQLDGKTPVNKKTLLKTIRQLPVRAKAICLVNLITANRPSEMTRLKVKDFNLEAHYIRVYMKKQKTWHYKRLTPEVVKAVKAYLELYGLKEDNYFVGRVYKNGRFESKKVSETSYSSMLKKWLSGLTGYNLRKTQIVFMHEAGADLSTIAKQTGHRSLITLEKHYLTVSDTTVDKYL